METFKTQFEMQSVLTNVTVEELAQNTYGCIINLTDFFEGGELPVTQHEHDIVIKRSISGEWEVVGEPKVKLAEDDIQNLGNAIEVDKPSFI